MLPKRTLSLLVVLFVASLVVAACGFTAETSPTTVPQPTAMTGQPTTAAGPEPTAPASATGSYRVGIFEDLKTINYWNYLGPGATVWSGYYLSPQRVALLGLADQSFALYPQVAQALPERPLAREDDLWVSEIKLKEGIMWSDGTPMTAKDVAFTANTALSLQLPGNWASNFDPNYIDRVEAVDDVTVKFYFTQEPGLAVYEYGALQTAILSEAYWSNVVASATDAIGALTPPAQGASQEEQATFEQQRVEALNVLFTHDPQGEPLAGAFVYGRYEPGAFATNNANNDFFREGAQVEVYANNAYREAKPGDYEVTVGDPVSGKLVEYTMGPRVSNTTYTIYGDQNSAILALQNGDIDYILNSLGLQRGLRSQVESREGIAVIENPTNGFRYLSFNTRREPLNDVAFRQAVAVLIDKQTVTEQILQGAAFPLYTWVPEGNSFWYTDDVEKWGLKEDNTPMSREERMTRATEILETAGYSWENGQRPAWDADNQTVTAGRLIMPNGQPLPEMELLAPGPGYDPLRSTFAVWIERYLSEFGIPVRANLTGFNNIVTKVFDEQDFDMYILGWSLTIFPDYLYDFFHSSRASLGDNNAGGYTNPEFDTLAEGIKSCTSFDQCKQNAVQIQQLLATEVPYVLLFDTGVIETYRSDAIEFPYTETLGGLQFVNGLPEAVHIK